MASFLGKAILGGGAVFYSYRISNAAIESLAERNKYSRKNIDERIRVRPKETSYTRQSMLQKLSRSEEGDFDVVIVGGNLRCSQLALDCSTVGLKTLLVDSKDFDSCMNEEPAMENPSSIEHLTNLKIESFVQDIAIEDNMSFLSSAPHLSYLSRTRICYIDLTSLVMGYFRHKLSDILTNKPPKYSATITTSLPLWCSPGDFAGSVETYQNNIDLSRLNLLTVLTAASHGAVVLNHVEAEQTIGNDDKAILLSLTDKLSGCTTRTKCKHFVKLKEKDNPTHQKDVQCFRVPEHLTESNISYIFPSEELSLRKYHNHTLACVHGQDSQRNAFEKLKSLIQRHFILRKGEIFTYPSRTITKNKYWEVISDCGTYQENVSNNPITKKTIIDTKTPLLGSHGWYPELSTMLHSKYGLPLDQCNQLTSHYGDLSVDIIKEITQHNELEAKTKQCLREMGGSLESVCSRLGVRDKEDVKRVASIMGQQLHWSRSVTDDQLMRTEKKLSDAESLQLWKSEEKFNEPSFSTSKKKQHEKFFRSNMDTNKGIKLCQVEDYVSDEKSLLREIINDDILESSLRKIDARDNGLFNEDLNLMQHFYIETPEELIDNHINQLKESNK